MEEDPSQKEWKSEKSRLSGTWEYRQSDFINCHVYRTQGIESNNT